MTSTHVGMRCPECAKQRTKVQTPRSIAGGDPRVTYTLIAINVLAFAAQVMGAGGARDTGASEVYREGVLWGPAVDAGEWWRLVSGGFLHDGPVHLLMNMVGVYFLGQLLEPRLGAVRFVGLYFASLLAGSLGVMLLSPEAPTLGASGAVFGLLGAAFFFVRRQGIDPMQTFIGPILILNVIITFAFRDTISVGGHLGGLAGGFLAALVIAQAEDRRSAALGAVGCAAIAVVAAVASVVAAGTPSLY
jgi:membrane associated rhomboid family serine protease